MASPSELPTKLLKMQEELSQGGEVNLTINQSPTGELFIIAQIIRMEDAYQVPLPMIDPRARV